MHGEGVFHVSSRDGARIAVWRSGEGRPLVLVHGTTVDHRDWAPVLPALRQWFTVYAMDRCGLGASEDPPNYQPEREFEDERQWLMPLANPASFWATHSARCAPLRPRG